jgi:hypothetical protein
MFFSCFEFSLGHRITAPMKKTKASKSAKSTKSPKKPKPEAEAKPQKTPPKFGVLGKDLSSQFSPRGGAWQPNKPGGRNGNGKPT